MTSNVIGNTDSNDIHLLFQGQLLHFTVAHSKGRGQGSGCDPEKNFENLYANMCILIIIINIIIIKIALEIHLVNIFIEVIVYSLDKDNMEQCLS